MSGVTFHLVRYSGHGLINEPFDQLTIQDHSNTELVRYSDPHCNTVDPSYSYEGYTDLNAELISWIRWNNATYDDQTNLNNLNIDEV